MPRSSPGCASGSLPRQPWASSASRAPSRSSLQSPSPRACPPRRVAACSAAGGPWWRRPVASHARPATPSEPSRAWVGPASAAPRAAAALHPIVLAAFYVMIVSFNFEMPNRSFGGWEIPAMTAALFLLTSPLALRACYGTLPGPLVSFGAFLWVFAVSTLVQGWVILGDVRHFFLVLLEALLVCWASVNLLARERVGTVALWCFVCSSVARAVLPMVGVGRTSYTVWTGGERVTAFGQNANFSAILLSAGLVTLLGLTDGQRGTPRWVRLLAWPMGALIGVAIVDTGSRGGLLALGAGLLAFVFTPAGSLKVRLRNTAVATLAIGLLTAAALHTAVMRNRFEATTETGSMAGREQLFPSLVDMFLERPLDRKSTRLNSSHGYISYAVFCLKKKKNTQQIHKHIKI